MQNLRYGNRETGDVVISESDDEWEEGDEGEETDSDHSYLDEEERQQEGFEIKRLKNEKARVTTTSDSDGCCWRIHASPTPDRKTYKIKTYNPVHSCIRTSKNSNATSTWIAEKLEKTFPYAKHKYYLFVTCRGDMKKDVGFENIITPRIRKVLDITMQDRRVCKATYAGDDEFQVKDGFTTFVVNLRAQTCGCNYWKLCGLPCKHACAFISYKRANVEMYCDGAYTTKMYCLAYTEIIHPMPELDTNNRGCYRKIDPSVLRRLSGRPRINRKRGLIEGPAGVSDKKLKVKRSASASSSHGASSQVTHENAANSSQVFMSSQISHEIARNSSQVYMNSQTTHEHTE
ncbi:Zinc finger, SWIM-type [Sesbania bispinosa]|nr:Zinc finger, SWIM-type [Sesbania bispinosa]